jgi:Protein of unknown function (DUF2752)
LNSLGYDSANTEFDDGPQRLIAMVTTLPQNAPVTVAPTKASLPFREGSNRQVWIHAGVIALLFVAAAILATRPQWITGLALPCVTWSIFHFKCPFCGMTRDFVAILHGQPPTLNPFSWAALVTLYLGYPCIFLLAWKKRRLDVFYQPVVYKIGLAGLVVMCVVNNLQLR